MSRSPVLFSAFRAFRRVGHGVGQTVDPHYDSHEKVKICNKKHQKSADFMCFWKHLNTIDVAHGPGPRTAGRRFCAVQAFSPRAKTLAQGEFISPEHFNQTGEGGFSRRNPKQKDIQEDVLLFWSWKSDLN